MVNDENIKTVGFDINCKVDDNINTKPLKWLLKGDLSFKNKEMIESFKDELIVLFDKYICPVDVNEITRDFNNIIFLDVDGVLNSEYYYENKYENALKIYNNSEKDRIDYYKTQIDKKSIDLLNDICAETKSVVVLSASMRTQYRVEDLQRIFNACGGTFKIIDKTDNSDHRIRGVEINDWLKNNIEDIFGITYDNFNNFVILDDDCDMLLWHNENFFNINRCYGLTHIDCYRIKRFLNNKHIL